MELFTADAIAGFDKRYRANFINSITGFKSVALIGTTHPNGMHNLAIFSQIIHVGANPPLIGILFRPHTVARHTLENIHETGFFTINHITQEFVVEAHHTSARWESSEFKACGLTPHINDSLPAPYVQEATLRIGCKFEEKLFVEANQTEFVIGQIQEVHLPHDFVSEDGFVDLELAGTLCASGLDSYHKTKKVGRYAYAKPDKVPEKI